MLNPHGYHPTPLPFINKNEEKMKHHHYLLICFLATLKIHIVCMQYAIILLDWYHMCDQRNIERNFYVPKLTCCKLLYRKIFLSTLSAQRLLCDLNFNCDFACVIIFPSLNPKLYNTCITHIDFIFKEHLKMF